MPRYSMAVTISGPLAEAKQRVVEALRAEGFGILTEIDVQQTLKAKLGIESEPYLILGACNPHYAHRAHSADPSLGLLLPCNVVLRQLGSETEISIADPEVIFEVADPGTAAALADLRQEARRRLPAALSALDIA